MTPSAYSPQVAEVEIPALSAVPIDTAALFAKAHHPGAGAVVLFSGEVRDSNHNNGVLYLDYEAHESLAVKMIEAIIKDALQKWPLNIAIAQHRTGKVAVGETAVVVITASAHRSEAYEANQYIIDRIKHEATIWKCEYFVNGTHEWGGNCSCH
jgi:molybdopterin synthase catalytic subunit